MTSLASLKRTHLLRIVGRGVRRRLHRHRRRRSQRLRYFRQDSGPYLLLIVFLAGYCRIEFLNSALTLPHHIRLAQVGISGKHALLYLRSHVLVTNWALGLKFGVSSLLG